MNCEQDKNTKGKGDIVYAIKDELRPHSTIRHTIYPRTIEEINENGAWFNNEPCFEYWEFLFPTKDDAIEFIQNN